MTIVLTGATSGIGLATAVLLAREGADIAMVGRTDESVERAVSAVRVTAGEGVRIDSHTADLGRVAEVERLAQRISAEHGQLAGLVLCAAVANPATPAAGDTDTALAVNHLSAVILSQRLDASLGGGRIILVSSSQHGSAGTFDPTVFDVRDHAVRKYQTTKLLNLLHAAGRLARPHLAPMEVVDPGFVRTRLGRNAPARRRLLLAVTRPFQSDPGVPAGLITRRLRADDFIDGAYWGLRGPAQRAPNVTDEAAALAWDWTQRLLDR
jgi:NAD(P)-dependent dehydrogenase (short-subunit alcohol dehydrogenase family)